MAEIVSVIVIDKTRPVQKKGFNAVMLCDLSKEIPLANITDPSKIDEGNTKKIAEMFFASGGTDLWIYGKVSADAETIKATLDSTKDKMIYGLLISEKEEEKLTAVKEWVQSNKKLALMELPVETAKSAVDLAKELSSERVAMYATSGEKEFNGTAGAVAGTCFPKDVGSIVWTNQAVPETKVSGFSDADEKILNEGNVNVIANVRGQKITFGGKTTGGNHIDITRTKDWIEENLSAEVTSLMINMPKIPYTTAGILQILSVMNVVGEQAISMGMLESYTTSGPDVKKIPSTDKANRELNGVTFDGVLSGGVEKIKINQIIRLS